MSHYLKVKILNQLKIIKKLLVIVNSSDYLSSLVSKLYKNVTLCTNLEFKIIYNLVPSCALPNGLVPK